MKLPSIRIRLIVVMVAGMMLGLGLVTANGVRLIDDAVEHSDSVHRTQLRKALVKMTAIPLFQRDAVALRDILSDFAGAGYLVFASVKDRDGQEFASFAADGYAPESPDIGSDGRGYSTRTEAVLLSGVSIGTITLTMSDAHRAEARHALLRQNVLLGILVLLAGLGVMILIIAYITRRMVALREGVAKVAAGDFGVRLPEGPPDGELATTVRALNRMLDGIQEAETRQRASEARYRTLAEFAPVGITQISPDAPTFTNKRWRELSGVLGTPDDEIKWTKYIHPEDRRVILERWTRAVAEKTSFGPLEYRYMHADGRLVWVQAQATLQTDDDGNIVGFVGTLTDITERNQAEEELRASEARLRAVTDALPDVLVVLSEDGSLVDVLRVPDELQLASGAPEPGAALSEILPPDFADTVTAAIRKAISTGEAQTVSTDLEVAAGRRFFEARLAPFPTSEGEAPAVVLLSRDITERRMAEQALHDSEAYLRAVLDNAADAIFTVDKDGRFETINRIVGDLTGYAPGELLGRPVSMLLPDEHRPGHRERWTKFAATGDSSQILTGREVMGLRKDGTQFPAYLSVGEFELGGRHVFLVTARDLTESRAIEEQLRQSQKMEAIGNLTGGVAHDFNNLLAIIMGNLELLMDAPDQDEDTLKLARTAFEATQRGAQLTHRLLAFSRKQPLQPKTIDINDVVAGMSDLLQRTLGESIEIKNAQERDLWACKADPAQLENVLLNVCVNARDAMPRGGRLTIETGNARLDEDYTKNRQDVAPGEYVMLAVTDTGAGMSPDIAERVFDPFFTTKGVGKGTGLGLSMAYGYVKQSRGHIALYSEVNEGTTVKIYLPRTLDAADDDDRDAENVPLASGETVLLVEDNDEVRTLGKTMLHGLGYRVIEAENGDHALAAVDADADIDLMLTDVVLPGALNGRELAETVKERCPRIAILYMSGYTENAIIHHGRLDEGVNLLQKPFRRADLAHGARAALGARQSD